MTRDYPRDVKDAEVQLGNQNVHKCASALLGIAYDFDSWCFGLYGRHNLHHQ